MEGRISEVPLKFYCRKFGQDQVTQRFPSSLALPNAPHLGHTLALLPRWHRCEGRDGVLSGMAKVGEGRERDGQRGGQIWKVCLRRDGKEVRRNEKN